MGGGEGRGYANVVRDSVREREAGGDGSDGFRDGRV